MYITARRHAEPHIPPAVHSDDAIREWIARVVLATHDVRVAEVGRRIVGMMALAGDLLAHLYVRPDFQGQGIGDRLVAEAKRLRPRQLRLYTFQSNVRAREFYEARGFVPIQLGDGSSNEERAPDVLYEWIGD